APPVLIEQATVDGSALASYHSPEPASRSNEVGMISLRAPGAILKVPAGHEQLKFDFTALGLASPRNVGFKYRLQGMDKTWVEAGSERSAQYAHVPPGTYRFQVTACNGDGVWNPKVATLDVEVLPYFWQTWWFRCAVILTFVAAVAGLARYFVARKMQRQV